MRILFFSILLMLFLSSCKSTNIVDNEVYESLKSGIELSEKDLNNYWKNDISLSERDKNSKKVRFENMKNAFKLLSVKK